MFHWFSKNSKAECKLTAERLSRLKTLCGKLGLSIRHYELLDQALTHSSCTDKSGEKDNYERLEFLGDSILNASIAYLLYTGKPDMAEGGLSALRSSLVDEKTLSEIAFACGIMDYINLGKGETLSDRRAREKVAADILESIIGVVFLDRGFAKALKFVEKLMAEEINKRLISGTRDFKTHLQKWAISRYKEYPVYEVVRETGPDHNKIFEVRVTVHSEYSASGSGRTKKEAEQKAAERVLRQINQNQAVKHD